MKYGKLKSWNMGVALVAAYMLVLQGLIGAFALGAAAASPMFDAFGNPLCITSSDSSDTGSDPIDHSSVPDCCTISCSMFAPVSAEDRTTHSLVNPLVPASTPSNLAFDTVMRAPQVSESPGSPRSPPLTS